jgi:zinc/manganese transport system substrate-binding protein
MPRHRTATIFCLAVLGGCLAGCGGGAPAGGRLRVVAAENFWGSIATQLAGSRASVSSIIVDPQTDPHSYDPTPADARAFAGAQLALINGIGYDGWASKLVAANPLKGRITLDVGALLHRHAGENPHQWYAPAVVTRVVQAVAAGLVRLDPHDRRYFEARERNFLTRSLAGYRTLIAQIASRFHGVAVGYSESIFAPLGRALRLRLLTPPGFAKAVAEGTDPTAAETETVQRQAQQRQIRVWVFNSQNVTPDVQRVNRLARAAGIPVVTVTETLSPADDTFEQWQVAQLRSLERALARGIGR